MIIRGRCRDRTWDLCRSGPAYCGTMTLLAKEVADQFGLFKNCLAKKILAHSKFIFRFQNINKINVLYTSKAYKVTL